MKGDDMGKLSREKREARERGRFDPPPRVTPKEASRFDRFNEALRTIVREVNEELDKQDCSMFTVGEVAAYHAPLRQR